MNYSEVKRKAEKHFSYLGAKLINVQEDDKDKTVIESTFELPDGSTMIVNCDYSGEELRIIKGTTLFKYPPRYIENLAKDYIKYNLGLELKFGEVSIGNEGGYEALFVYNSNYFLIVYISDDFRVTKIEIAKEGGF